MLNLYFQRVPEVYWDASMKFVVQHCSDACITPVLVDAHANVNHDCGGEGGVHDYGTVTMVTISDQTARRQKLINHHHAAQPNRLLSKLLVFARMRARMFTNCHCCREIIKINKNIPFALVSNNNNGNNNNNDNTRCGWRQRKQNQNASNGTVNCCLLYRISYTQLQNRRVPRTYCFYKHVERPT